MSVDFTFIQAGPTKVISTLFATLETQLKPLGFTRSTILHRVELDARDVFEETGEEIAISALNKSDNVNTLKNTLNKWNGLAVEFHNSRYTVYLLLCNYKNRYLNSFIEISGKTMETLLSEKIFNDFIQWVNIVALSTNSQGGYGSYELPFEPISPLEIVSGIFKNNLNAPSLIGIAPKELESENQRLNTISEEFELNDLDSNYYFLEHKDFRGL